MKNKNLIPSLLYLISYGFVLIVMLFTQESQYNSLFIANANPTGDKLFKISLMLVIIFQIGLRVTSRNLNRTFLVSLVIILFLVNKIYQLKILDTSIFLLALLIINSDFVNGEEFLKFDFAIKLISISIIVVMSFMHLFPYVNNVLMYRNGVLRSSLGFVQPNIAAGVILSCMLSYMLVKSKKLLRSIFILMIFVLVGMLTDSRGFQVSGILIMIGYLINWEKSKISSKLIKFISIFLNLLAPLISFFYVYNFNSTVSLWYKLDTLLSSRISLQSEVVRIYPIKWIGQSVNLGTQSIWVNGWMRDAWVDNAYILVSLKYGLLGLFFILCFFELATIRASRRKLLFLSVVFIALGAHSLVEAQIFNLYMIAPLIYTFSQDKGELMNAN